VGPLFAVQYGGKATISGRYRHDRGTQGAELYDMNGDSAQQRNLAEELPELWKQRAALLDAVIDKYSEPLAEEEHAAPDAALVHQLQDVGYMGGDE
jgi:hypothetical protein